MIFIHFTKYCNLQEWMYYIVPDPFPAQRLGKGSGYARLAGWLPTPTVHLSPLMLPLWQTILTMLWGSVQFFRGSVFHKSLYTTEAFISFMFLYYSININSLTTEFQEADFTKICAKVIKILIKTLIKASKYIIKPALALMKVSSSLNRPHLLL